MGGNAKAIDRVTGNVKIFNGREAFAERVNISNVDLSKLKHEIFEVLQIIQNRAIKNYDGPIWPNFPKVWESGLFNGSAGVLFSEISQNEIIRYKSFLGDIDVMVPQESLVGLFETLAGCENKSVGNFLYVGQNRQNLHGSQISSVWWHHDLNKFIQIDFEGVEFVGDLPSPFARFAHSSSWVDTKAGLKGVAHKYLLMTLVWVTSQRPDVVVLTDKSPTWPIEKIRRKTLHQPPRVMSFSVDKGLRNRLVLQRGPNGEVLKLPDGMAFKELPTSESKYITNLDEIFYKIFKVKPLQGDIERMSSFLGLIELCKLHLKSHHIREAFDQLVRYKLFGSGQALSRDSADEDLQVKSRIIDRLLKEFPYLRDAKTPVSDLMIEYYKSYRERDISE